MRNGRDRPVMAELPSHGWGHDETPRVRSFAQQKRCVANRARFFVYAGDNYGLRVLGRDGRPPVTKLDSPAFAPAAGRIYREKFNAA